MIFRETTLRGAYLIEPELLHDERGFFARVFCQQEFELRGLSTHFVQCSISHNARKGTLRGMHYQAAPHEEAKLIRCTRGAIYDVIVDLRRDSPTFRRWAAVELTAENRFMLYVPQGLAHGFQTLCDDAEVFYQISEFYHPEGARGIRWNDRGLAISWPLADPIMSQRDADFPELER